MTTAWLEIGLSNALVATVLAALAFAFSRRMRPRWALAVWLLVLVKLLTPPIWNLPLASIYTLLPKTEAAPAVDRLVGSGTDWLVPPVADSHTPVAVEDLTALHPQMMIPAAVVSKPAAPNSNLPWIASSLVCLWATGTMAWMILSMRRIWQFTVLLRRARCAPRSLQEEVRTLAERLGLKQVPDVRITRRRISPFVWALFGRPTILLPAGLLRKLSRPQRTALLLHELAHLRRRDHWTKLVELAAVSVYWWLPTAWWARRHADQAAEHCCDALVVSQAPTASRAYAEALLTTIDFLSGTPAPLPLGASGFSQFGYVSRRIEMILEPEPRRRQSLGVCLAMVAIVVATLPLSVQRLWGAPSVATRNGVADAIQQESSPAIESQQAEPSIAGGLAAGEPPFDKDDQGGKKRDLTENDIERELGRIERESGQFAEWELGFTSSISISQRKSLATIRNLQLQLARENTILDELKTLRAKWLDSPQAKYLNRAQLEHDIRLSEWRIKNRELELQAAKILFIRSNPANPWRKSSSQRSVDQDWLSDAAQTSADKSSQPAVRVAVLKAEVAGAKQVFDYAQEKLAEREVDDPTVDQLWRAFRQKHFAASDEMLEIAKADPTSAAGFAALEWLLMNPRSQNTAGFPTALLLLIEHHAANPEMGKGLSIIGYYLPDQPPAPELTVKLFEAVIEKNPDRTARGHAALGLAWLARDKFLRAKFKGAANARDLAAIAEEQLEAVIREYGDCKNLRSMGARPAAATLRGEAESELFELRRLQVGQLAPEIEGEDLNGKKFKLSDFRGKVTVLVFWDSPRGECMSDVAHEKELSARFEGRPFAIVGVNCDEARADAQAIVEKHAIPWRSFWNGGQGAGGPIALAWNVRSWPRVYVIDHKGVIRHKQVRGEELLKPLEELIAAAEAATTSK